MIMITKEEFIKIFDTKESTRMSIYVEWNKNTDTIEYSSINERPSVERNCLKAKKVYRILINNTTIDQINNIYNISAPYTRAKNIIDLFKSTYNISGKIVLVEGTTKRVCDSDAAHFIWPSHRKHGQTWYIATGFEEYELTQEESEAKNNLVCEKNAIDIYKALILPSVEEITMAAGFTTTTLTMFDTDIANYRASPIKDKVIALVKQMVTDKLKEIGFTDCVISLLGSLQITVDIDPKHNLFDKIANINT